MEIRSLVLLWWGRTIVVQAKPRRRVPHGSRGRQADTGSYHNYHFAIVASTSPHLLFPLGLQFPEFRFLHASSGPVLSPLQRGRMHCWVPRTNDIATSSLGHNKSKTSWPCKLLFSHFTALQSVVQLSYSPGVQCRSSASQYGPLLANEPKLRCRRLEDAT